MTAEIKELALFQRYIQSTERIVDLITDLLTELLHPDYRKAHTEGFWRLKLNCAAESSSPNTS